MENIIFFQSNSNFRKEIFEGDILQNQEKLRDCRNSFLAYLTKLIQAIIEVRPSELGEADGKDVFGMADFSMLRNQEDVSFSGEESVFTL